ncbi:MAG: acyl-CoA dehydrogenase family protein [Rhodobacteraceae bacterium]|nr:acyl-CoA dehydrogenase family protein [Paracoccaceae bacterium]
MHFELTDDRRMLADTLNRFLTDTYGIEHRNKVAYEAPFHDPAKWAELAELGPLFALVPEEQGGFGGAGFDIATVFEPLGRALCPEPVLPALMAARLLAAAGEDLEPLLSGATRYAVALGETDAPYALEDIATEAAPAGEGWELTGRKSVVYGGNAAGKFLVAARAGDVIGVYEVDAEDAAVTGYGMIDGGGAAEVFLEKTKARQVLADAGAALQDALDFGALALCAEAVGAMDVTYDMTLDYLKTRKQFGRAIGSFQALQHRMVEMKTEIEQARSITILAASRMGTEEQSRTVSMAKNLIGRAAKLVAEEAIQMHGGIAMTWEYPASHYAKRLVMIDHQLGDTDHHLEKVMAGLQVA